LELATDHWSCARQTRLTVGTRIALALVESMVLRRRRDVHDFEVTLVDAA
jgi:hypothetical protein